MTSNSDGVQWWFEYTLENERLEAYKAPTWKGKSSEPTSIFEFNKLFSKSLHHPKPRKNWKTCRVGTRDPPAVEKL